MKPRRIAAAVALFAVVAAGTAATVAVDGTALAYKSKGPASASYAR